MRRGIFFVRGGGSERWHKFKSHVFIFSEHSLELFFEFFEGVFFVVFFGVSSVGGFVFISKILRKAVYIKVGFLCKVFK